MSLTKRQYNDLDALHQSELESTKRQQKLIALALYLEQAQELLFNIESMTDDVYTDTNKLTKELAKNDLMLDDMNVEIGKTMIQTVTAITILGVEHTEDYPRLAGRPTDIPNTVITDVVSTINRPVKGSDFRLSSSVWQEKHKLAVYNDVIKGSKGGLTLEETIKRVRPRLLNPNKGGQFYKVERVIDTEYNRTYERTGLESTREFNRTGEPKLLWERSLSPAHVVPDICDELVGTYEAESDVPENPHPNCVIGDTVVLGRDIKTKFTSFHSGNVVTITTKKGSILTVTPNHPMLTPAGWVFASKLKTGDNLFRQNSRFESSILSDPDVKAVKAKIKDISIPDGMIFRDVPTAAKDFHGEGEARKNVNIVFANGSLGDKADIVRFKFLNDNSFIKRNISSFFRLKGLSSLQKLFFRSFSATSSLISRLRNFLPLRTGGTDISHLLGLLASAQLDSIGNKFSINSSTGDIELFSLRESPLIELDEIVDINIHAFKGKVYNIETKGHWYSANSIITHNCLCLKARIFADDYSGSLTTLPFEDGIYTSTTYKNQSTYAL